MAEHTHVKAAAEVKDAPSYKGKASEADIHIDHNGTYRVIPLDAEGKPDSAYHELHGHSFAHVNHAKAAAEKASLKVRNVKDAH